MRKIIILLGLIVFALNVKSQDIIEAEGGEITISPVVHGTLVLEWQNKTIYVDPYGGAEGFSSFENPDLIIITDIHGDHHNQQTLDALSLDDASFIVPQAVFDKLPEAMQTKSMVINNMEEKEWEGIIIKAIPMYNLPETEESRHPKGRGNGYILTMGGKKIYLSGDTEDIQEMRALRDIDVAFVCMNLPYTMDVDQAADAVNEFQPKIVYPYHYRGSGGLSDIEKFKSLVTAEGVEVRLRNWYPQ